MGNQMWPDEESRAIHELVQAKAIELANARRPQAEAAPAPAVKLEIHGGKGRVVPSTRADPYFMRRVLRLRSEDGGGEDVMGSFHITGTTTITHGADEILDREVETELRESTHRGVQRRRRREHGRRMRRFVVGRLVLIAGGVGGLVWLILSR